MKPKRQRKTSVSDLYDDFVAGMSERVSQMLGPDIMRLAEGFGVEVGEIVRFMPLSRKCAEARQKAGLTVAEIAKQLEVPQYRIRAIEAGQFQSIEPAILHKYIERLGLAEGLLQWCELNPELAVKLRSSTTGQPKRGEHEKARQRVVPGSDGDPV